MATGVPQEGILPCDHKFEEVQDKLIKKILLYTFDKKRRKQEKPLKEVILWKKIQ